MFVIMDGISPWPPVNCNDCRNVSCTEAEQEKAMGKPAAYLPGIQKAGFSRHEQARLS